MFATPAHLPKLLPWVDWTEWADCKAGLFHTSPVAALDEKAGAARPLPLSLSSSPPTFTPTQLSHLQLSLDTIAVWRARGRLPLSVDITAQLLSVQRDDAACAADGTALRQQYALCIIRLVNGLVDSSQRSTHALSVALLASSLHLPRLLVDVRHDSTHSQLPSLPVLRYAAWEALRWLWTHYWQQQDSGTDVLHTNISRALQVWRDSGSTQAAAEEERVRVAVKEFLAVPVASVYLSSVLVAALFPSSSTHCLQPPSTASFRQSSPTTAAADVYFASVLCEWQPLLSAVGKRLREFRVEALRHTITQLVAATKQQPEQTTDEADNGREDDNRRQWRVQLLTRWSQHLVQSLSAREGTVTLYTNLAALCLLDTTDSCHAVLQALMGRVVALDGEASEEWADVLTDSTDGQRKQKRKRPSEQPDTNERMHHDEPTLDAMQALTALEQRQTADAEVGAAGGSVGPAECVADIALCEEWVACPIGVLPHQSSPQLSVGRQSMPVDRQSAGQLLRDNSAEMQAVVSSETKSHEREPAVSFCVAGWDVPETELVALRPWQAAISALSQWQMTGSTAQSIHTNG